MKELLSTISLIADEIYFIKDLDRVHKETSKVLSYPIEHFASYASIVLGEVIDRGISYKLDINTLEIICRDRPKVESVDIFGPWHDSRYLISDYHYIMCNNEFNSYTKELMGKRIEELYYNIC